MKLTRLVATTIVLAVLLVSSLPALAQGTIADYQRAMGLRDRFDGLTVDVPEAANWIEETNRFWYRKSVAGGNEFVLFDAATLEKGPAFDHERVATALSEGAEEPYTAVTLPFRTFEFVDDGERHRGPDRRDGLEVRPVTSYACESTGRPGAARLRRTWPPQRRAPRLPRRASGKR